MTFRASHNRSPRNLEPRAAFTLIELLVVVAIIAILAISGGVAYRGALKKKTLISEVSAGKQLAVAYALFAAENNGLLMTAYDKFEQAIQTPGGQNVFGESVFRYPYRLGQYMQGNPEGVMLAGENKFQIEEIKRRTPPPHFGYYESLYPSFGINAYYIGGYIEDSPGIVKFGDEEVARRMVQVRNPSKLIVFASAKMSGNNSAINGHFYVKAPKFVARAPGTEAATSPDWPNNGTTEAQGYLDDRHANKVLCVFLDGSIAHLPLSELSNDMRYWSHNASESDNAFYTPTLKGGSSGGGRPGRN